MVANPRITQKEIARRLGLTQAAVSLALANHTSIPSKTRQRIQSVARKLGYVPDPFLSGLSAYRKRIRPAHFQGNLAWLSNYPDREGWRYSSTFVGYFNGAVKRAAELGYQIEEHWLHSEGMTSMRMERILKARNMSGLLLAPQPKPNLGIDFCFDHFSAVTFGYTLAKPQLNLVALHQFRSMETALRKLQTLGYKRPGLALADDSDQRADRNWSAAFWSEQRRLPQRDRIPLLLSKPLDQPTFTKWFRKYRPDVVLAIWPQVYDWLEQAGESIPQSTGLSLLSVPDEGRKFSGIWENPQMIGAKAVEFLIDMIHRGECGIPPIPICMLVEGTWMPGKTVRTRA
ncbi:MAG: LacI family transcriptional regulator [Verrucomicrobia bacterium Tous-C9LFEB]|nr:MAG: LacI family transcriptional regulator [Verrucomicrobia bacterium Tous-C9LFEB]